MFIRFVSGCVALLSAPLLTFGQNTEPEIPQYYIGISAFTNYSQRLSRELDKSTVPPLQLTLGTQLTRRWAVQVSGAYSSSPGTSITTILNIFGEEGEYYNAYRNTALTLMALGRYTLTPTLSHRFQIDALGGITWDHETHKHNGYYPMYLSNGRIPVSGRSQTNHYALSVGPSFRYRLFSSLEAVGEGTVNVNSRSLRNVTTSGAVGLRYQFGYQ